ncbi:alpha-L-fucosidase [uncultured Sunxiuqinia sp.]|uniref:alpha-L-fucosidase n=1 Tax=uncultured Sunxiuqinia sp. TaxID=1573825 RepID=UPI00262A4949|nr:alpha-L-fucosidase [uncultured Sunxiuqinia sp.]
MKYLYLILSLFLSLSCSADEDVSGQSKIPENVIVIDFERNTDNITVLMAASAEMSEGLQVKWPDKPPKHFWVEGLEQTEDFLKWEIYSEKEADFYVDALLSSATGETFEIEVINNQSSARFEKTTKGWDKTEAGIISLSKGINTIALRKLTNNSSVSIKSLELVEKSKRAAQLQRIQEFKADTQWLSDSGYGLMFQFGGWTYPENGDTKKSLDELAKTFDIPAFIEMVKSTGAKYVIWSLTWWDYNMMMPVQAVDEIVGNSKRTSSYNFIGKLAEELQKSDIRFMLYYHLGHASHIGGKTDWWQAQKWPAQFAATGTGNRELFFENWMSVVGEIGKKLGKNLDGWWFDDGLIYYPAPFEKMGAVARRGNPDRLVAYNSWICARYTDFQDVYFGEGSHGEISEGSAPVGGDGIFTSGPQKGLLQHSMFTMENGWGIYKPNQKINPRIDIDTLVKWLKSAKQRRVPLSINLMMWEDGTVSDHSLSIIKEMKEEFEK